MDNINNNDLKCEYQHFYQRARICYYEKFLKEESRTLNSKFFKDNVLYCKKGLGKIKPISGLSLDKIAICLQTKKPNKLTLATNITREKNE